MTATTGMGVFEIGNSPIERFDHNGFEAFGIEIANPALCHAVTRGYGETIIGPFDPDRQDVGSLPLSALEKEAYNDREAEDIVRDLVEKFVQQTGVFRMKVHVVKKAFASNGKVSVAVLIEETPG